MSSTQSPRKFPKYSRSSGRLSVNRLATSLAIVATLFSVPAAFAANTQDNVLPGATDLGNTASATTYQTPPTTTSDVTFAPNTTYTGLTITSGPLSAGTLNDVDVQAVSISGATQAVTLAAGGNNSVAPAYGGSAADVLFVAAGGKFTLAQSATTPSTGITLSGAGTIDVQGQLNLTGTPMTLNGNLTVLSTASVASSVTAPIALGALSGTGNITLNNSQNTLQNGVPASSSVVNTVDLTAASAFTGTVDVQQGSVAMNVSGALGGAANTITLGDVGAATLNVNSASATTFANNIISAGSASNVLTTSSGTLNTATFTGNVTLNNNLTLVGGTAKSTLLLSGVISGSGGLTITNVTGALTGADTYTGPTTVNNGFLNIGNSTTTGSITGSALVLNAGDVLMTALGTFTQTFTGTTLSNGLSIASSTISTDTLALGNITRNTGATLDFNSNNASSYGGAVTFSNSLTNSILGPWATYGGLRNGTNANGVRYATITGGKAAPYTGTTAADPTGLVSSATANYELVNGSTTPLTGSVAANTIRFGSTSTVGTLDLGGNTLTLSGFLNDGAGLLTIQNGTLAIGSNNELILNGFTATTIAASIVDNGTIPSALTTSFYAGPLVLSGNSTYSGGTFINAGTVQLGVGAINALGSHTAPLTVNAPTGTTGVTSLDLNGNSMTVGALNGVGGTNSQGTNEIGTITNTNAAPVTLTIGNGGGSGTYSGTISAGTGGAISLVKAGSGTEVLSSALANAYTGGTTVNAGTLSGDTASYSSGNVTVNSGGTVDYTIAQDRSYAPSIGGTGLVTIHASGHTFTYTGVDSATGGTTVSSGSLFLNKTGGGALTGPVGVATSATVGLGANSEIASTSNVTLLGGKLAANGHSDGSSGTPGIGTLQLGDPAASATNSTIDFGDAGGTNVNILAFSDSSTLTWNGTVTLTNYTDGTDRLYIGTSNTLTTTQLSDIIFNGQTAGQDATGKITFAAAPEPSGWVSMIIGVGVMGSMIARMRRSTYGAA